MNILFQKRHSGRSYDPHKLVAVSQLKELLEAARWAPSCFGEEPWRYIICRKDKALQAYNQLLSCLDPSNQVWAQHAPVLLLSVACETFSKTQKYNRWAQHDTGAASISLALEAVDKGLMVHQMGGFDAKKTKEFFLLPEDCVPMAIIAVGYEAKEAPDKNAPRSRKPYATHFFEEKWGQPAHIFDEV